MRYTHGRLTVFISSTADLGRYRDAVEGALRDLEVDGKRFEAWPSTPGAPIGKCLEEVRSSDALVLILGDRYGTVAPGSLSVTHLEYREAIGSSPRKPIFAYVLPPDRREARQEAYVKEVERSQYRSCVRVTTPEGLAEQVRLSFLAEFARCFKDVWKAERREPLPSVPDAALIEQGLPLDPGDAVPFLNDLYTRGADLALHELRGLLTQRFGGSSSLMGFVHMATINLAMSGYEIQSDELEEAISFWDSEEASRRVTAASRYYNQGNALGALGEHRQAVGKYKLALEEDGSMAEVWKNLGTAYEALHEIDEAEKCFREALSHDSKLFEAQLALGQFLLREGRDPREALDVLDGIDVGQIASHHHASVMAWKALAHQKLGAHGKAIALAEQAIRMDPTARWSWRWGGRVHALAWREDREFVSAGLKFFGQLTARYPDDAEAWAELAQLQWLQHNDSPNRLLVDAACAAFEKAIALGIEDSAVLFDRFGHALQEKGEPVRAEEAHRKAFELDPGTAYCLGVCLITQEKYDEALPYVLHDAKSVHRDTRSWFQVGRSATRSAGGLRMQREPIGGPSTWTLSTHMRGTTSGDCTGTKAMSEEPYGSGGELYGSSRSSNAPMRCVESSRGWVFCSCPVQRGPSSTAADQGTSLKARGVPGESLSVYLHGSLSVILPSNPVC